MVSCCRQSSQVYTGSPVQVTETTYQNASKVAEKVSSCAICLADYTPGEKLSGHDSHLYHKNCLDRWFTERPNCPTCRAPFKGVGQSAPSAYEPVVILGAESLPSHAYQLAFNSSVSRVARAVSAIASALFNLSNLIVRPSPPSQLLIISPIRFSNEPISPGALSQIFFDDQGTSPFEWDRRPVNREPFDWDRPIKPWDQ